MAAVMPSLQKGFLPAAHPERKELSYVDKQMFIDLDLAPNKWRFSWTHQEKLTFSGCFSSWSELYL